LVLGGLVFVPKTRDSFSFPCLLSFLLSALFFRDKRRQETKEKGKGKRIAEEGPRLIYHFLYFLGGYIPWPLFAPFCLPIFAANNIGHGNKLAANKQENHFWVSWFLGKWGNINIEGHYKRSGHLYFPQHFPNPKTQKKEVKFIMTILTSPTFHYFLGLYYFIFFGPRK